MDSDVRNLGRLCRFVSSVLPFDPALVQLSGHVTLPCLSLSVLAVALQPAV